MVELALLNAGVVVHWLLEHTDLHPSNIFKPYLVMLLEPPELLTPLPVPSFAKAGPPACLGCNNLSKLPTLDELLAPGLPMKGMKLQNASP